MNFKGAILDVDGTLFDSMSIWRSIARQYLNTLGQIADPSLDDIVHGMSLEEGSEYLKKTYSLPISAEEIANGINLLTENKYFYEIQLKPGVKKLLDDFSKKGVKMCIATVTDKYLIERALLRVGINGYFEDILTCAQVGSSKKRPDIYEAALSVLKTGKNNTIIFEDAAYAVKTAKEAGFTVAGIYDIHEPNQEYIKSVADLYITDYTKISYDAIHNELL